MAIRIILGMSIPNTATLRMPTSRGETLPSFDPQAVAAGQFNCMPAIGLLLVGVHVVEQKRLDHYKEKARRVDIW